MPDRTHPLVDEIIAEMARNQPLVENLLKIHVPDQRGRCAGCYLDDKLRKEQWPCKLQWYAGRARHHGQRRAG